MLCDWCLAQSDTCSHKTQPLVCGSCKVATYCSKRCQILHWKAKHRKTCSFFVNVVRMNGDAISVECRRIDRIRVLCRKAESMFGLAHSCRLILNDVVLSNGARFWQIGAVAGSDFCCIERDSSCPSLISSDSD